MASPYDLRNRRPNSAVAPIRICCFERPPSLIEISRVCSIDGKVFEDCVDKFFFSVLDLCSQAQDGTALCSLLKQLRHERDDPELAAWRSLEARLGYDPDEAPDGLITVTLCRKWKAAWANTQ